MEKKLCVDVTGENRGGATRVLDAMIPAIASTSNRIPNSQVHLRITVINSQLLKHISLLIFIHDNAHTMIRWRLWRLRV